MNHNCRYVMFKLSCDLRHNLCTLNEFHIDFYILKYLYDAKRDQWMLRCKFSSSDSYLSWQYSFYCNLIYEHKKSTLHSFWVCLSMCNHVLRVWGVQAENFWKVDFGICTNNLRVVLGPKTQCCPCEALIFLAVLVILARDTFYQSFIDSQ